MNFKTCLVGIVAGISLWPAGAAVIDGSWQIVLRDADKTGVYHAHREAVVQLQEAFQEGVGLTLPVVERSKADKAKKSIFIGPEAAAEAGFSTEGKVSVELRDDKTPEIFTFVLKDGQRSQSKIGELGVDDPTWKPKAWTAAVEGGVVRFTIPFADLGRTPSVGDRWMAALAATDGQETCKLPVKAESAAEMFFSDAAKTGVKVLRWTGNPERDDARNDAWREAGLKAGYDYVFGSRISVLEGDSATTDIFWFADTDPQHVTSEFWGQLGEFVKGGKTAVFIGYGEVPFEKIFKDVKVGKESFDYGKGRVILLKEPPADEIAFLKGL